MFDKVSLGTALAVRDVLLSDEPVQDKMKVLQRVEVNSDSSVTQILRAKDFESILGEKEAQHLRTLFAQSIGPTFKSSPVVHVRDTVHKIEDILNKIFDGHEVDDVAWENLERHRNARPKFSSAFSAILLENSELMRIHVENGHRLEVVLDPLFKRPGKGRPATPFEKIVPDIDRAQKSIEAMGAGGFMTERRGVQMRRNSKLQFGGAPGAGSVDAAVEDGQAAVGGGSPDAAPIQSAVGQPETPAAEPVLEVAPVNRYEDAPAAGTEADEANAPALPTEGNENEVSQAPVGLSFSDLDASEKARVLSAIGELGFEGDLEEDAPTFFSEHAEGSRLFLSDQMMFEEMLLKRKRALFIRDGILEEISAERQKAREAEAAEKERAVEADGAATIEPFTNGSEELKDVADDAAQKTDLAMAAELSQAQETIESLRGELLSSEQELSSVRERVAALEDQDALAKERISELEQLLDKASDNSDLQALNEKIEELRAELDKRPALDGEYRNRLATILSEKTAEVMMKSVPAIPPSIVGIDQQYARALMLRPVINGLRVGLAAEGDDGVEDPHSLRRFLLDASIAVLDERAKRSNTMVFEAAMEALGLPIDADIDKVVEDAEVLSFLKFFENSRTGDGSDGLKMFVGQLDEMHEAVVIADRLRKLGIDDVDQHIEVFKRMDAKLNEARGEIESLNATVERLRSDDRETARPAPAPAPEEQISPQFLRSWEVTNLLMGEGASFIAPGILQFETVVFYIQSDDDDRMIDRGGGVHISFDDAMAADDGALRESQVKEFCIVSRGDPHMFQNVIKDYFLRAQVDSVSPSRDAILKQLKDMRRRAERA